MDKIRCKRCFDEFEDWCPIPVNGLCDTCHSETLNPIVCIWCGEREKEFDSQCCVECAPIESPLLGEC